MSYMKKLSIKIVFCYKNAFFTRFWVEFPLLFLFLGGFCYYSLRRWFTLCLKREGGEWEKKGSLEKRGVFALGHIYYLTGIWESSLCVQYIAVRSLHFEDRRKNQVCFQHTPYKILSRNHPFYHMLQIKQVSSLCRRPDRNLHFPSSKFCGVFTSHFHLYRLQKR